MVVATRQCRGIITAQPSPCDSVQVLSVLIKTHTHELFVLTLDGLSRKVKTDGFKF